MVCVHTVAARPSPHRVWHVLLSANVVVREVKLCCPSTRDCVAEHEALVDGVGVMDGDAPHGCLASSQ